MSAFAIALAQINPKVGDLEGNFELHRRAIEKAKAQGCRLLIFPELSLIGYPPRDILDSPSFVDAARERVEHLAKEAADLTLVVGGVERHAQTWGRPLHNCAFVLQDRKVRATYRKQLLPYYDVFDEPRHFEPGATPVAFEVAGKTFAVTICEDVWSFSPFLARLYSSNPIDQWAGKKLDGLVNLSASPFSLGRPEIRQSLLRQITTSLGVPVLFCNQWGGNDSVLFDGCSFSLDRKGKVTAQAPAFRDALLIVDIERSAGEIAAWPSAVGDWLVQSLATGLSDYFRKTGNTNAVLGLSGGIDSAVVAALAVHALGKENVSLFGLPSRYNAPSSLEDAREMASKLGCHFSTIPIESIFAETLSALHQNFSPTLASLTEENLQPRIRSLLLMAVANEKNSLLLNTSNKSEIATGYSTLYGDSAGALAVIGDLTKAQVRELGRALNGRMGNPIPERIFAKAPSAELKPNQKDEDTLPPYDILDRMVEGALEKNLDGKQLISLGFDPSLVAQFFRLYAGSEYKRHQLAPTLRISTKAFGLGRRMPIAAKLPT